MSPLLASRSALAPHVLAGVDSPTPTGGVAAVPAAPRTATTWWRCVVAGPAIAAVTLIVSLVATNAADVPLRDPKGVTLTRLVIAVVLVALAAAADVAIRAVRNRRRGSPAVAALRAAAQERWTWRRGIAVGLAVLSFFATYLAYRNLKSVVPILRPGDLFDRQLMDLDRAVFGGNDPYVLLHDLLGTGAAAHGLSAVYMFFFAFIPLTIACAFAFLPDIRAALTYTTALAANWMLAAGSYFMFPSIGPFHADAAAFTALPATAVSDLQRLLLDERVTFLREPAAEGAAQSIGAFASLHTSIVFTAAVAAHLLGLPRAIRIAAWAFVVLTIVSTLYFGWHYVSDDVFGIVIAIAALALARAVTGYDLRSARREAA